MTNYSESFFSSATRLALFDLFVRTNINIAPTTSVRISCNQKRICITLKSIIIVGKRALNALKLPWAISPVIGFPPEALITQEKIYDKPIQPKTNAIKGIYTCSVPDMNHNGMCQQAHTRPNIIFPIQRPYFFQEKAIYNHASLFLLALPLEIPLSTNRAEIYIYWVITSVTFQHQIIPEYTTPQ